MHEKKILRTIHISLLTLFSLVAGGVWLYWEYVCTEGACTWEVRNFLFRPLIWGSLALSITLASLLVFPTKLFKHWVLHIAVWAVPLALLVVLGENPRSSDILSFGRGLLSWLLGTLIFAITVLYTIGWHFYFLRKGEIQRRNLLRLLWFLVPAVLIKIVWQLF